MIEDKNTSPQSLNLHLEIHSIIEEQDVCCVSLFSKEKFDDMEGLPESVAHLVLHVSHEQADNWRKAMRKGTCDVTLTLSEPK